MLIDSKEKSQTRVNIFLGKGINFHTFVESIDKLHSLLIEKLKDHTVQKELNVLERGSGLKVRLTSGATHKTFTVYHMTIEEFKNFVNATLEEIS